MINHLAIQNFKSIGEPGVELELRPLTLFVGPNGGGKSCVLEAVAIASSADFPQHLVGYDRDVNLFHRKDLNRVLEINIKLDKALAVTGSPEGWVAIPEITFQAVGPTRETDPLISGHRISGSDLRTVLGYRSKRSYKGDDAMVRAAVSEQLAPVFLIASTRGLLHSGRLASQDEPRWAGRHGQNLIPLLTTICSPYNSEVRTEISSVMKRFGMDDPWAGSMAGLLRGAYEDSELDVILDADSGSAGARQALVVVTQVAWSKPDSLIMIEEPEISLHPEAQVEMCRFLARHAAQGKQIIVTTHSQFMLLALQKPIQEGVISSDKVAIYHVERNRDAARGEIGATIADPLPFAKEGYLEEWVPSFSEVEVALARQWAEAVMRTESQEKPQSRRIASRRKKQYAGPSGA